MIGSVASTVTCNFTNYVSDKHTVDMKLLKLSAVSRALVVALTYATAICLNNNYTYQ